MFAAGPGCASRAPMTTRDAPAPVPRLPDLFSPPAPPHTPTPTLAQPFRGPTPDPGVPTMPADLAASTASSWATTVAFEQCSRGHARASEPRASDLSVFRHSLDQLPYLPRHRPTPQGVAARCSP
jgi:hypothetical protein